MQTNVYPLKKWVGILFILLLGFVFFFLQQCQIGLFLAGTLKTQRPRASQSLLVSGSCWLFCLDAPRPIPRPTLRANSMCPGPLVGWLSCASLALPTSCRKLRSACLLPPSGFLAHSHRCKSWIGTSRTIPCNYCPHPVDTHLGQVSWPVDCWPAWSVGGPEESPSLCNDTLQDVFFHLQ